MADVENGDAAGTRSTRNTRPTALPEWLRAAAGAAVVLAAAVLILLGVLYHGASSTGRVDTWAVSVVDALPPARTLARVVDFAAEPTGAIVLVAALVAACLLLRRWRLAALAAIGPALTGAGTTLLKLWVDRTIHGDNLAYPSGHTAVATALALVLGLLLIDVLLLRRSVAALVLAGAALLAGGLMAWAQVALDAHYPTDTVGGFCAALVLVLATAWTVDQIASRGGELLIRSLG